MISDCLTTTELKQKHKSTTNMYMMNHVVGQKLDE